MKIKTQIGIIILICTTVFSAASARQTIPEKIFQFLDGIFYNINAPIIRLSQSIRGAALTVLYSLQYDSNSPEKSVAAIEKRLETIRTILLAREQQALEAIKKRFSIADDAWQQCLNSIETLKNNNRKAFNQSWNTRHDTAISSELLDILKAILAKNGINPASININKKASAVDGTTQAQSVVYANIYERNGKELHIDQSYIPQAIEFFSNLEDKTVLSKIAICAHEVEHLLQQHTIVILVIPQFIANYCAIPVETIENDPTYKRLCKLQESQAEIFSSLRDPYIAHAMRTWRSKTYYPGNLYEDHYYYLCLIDELWKLHAKFSQNMQKKTA